MASRGWKGLKPSPVRVISWADWEAGHITTLMKETDLISEIILVYFNCHMWVSAQEDRNEFECPRQSTFLSTYFVCILSLHPALPQLTVHRTA